MKNVNILCLLSYKVLARGAISRLLCEFCYNHL